MALDTIVFDFDGVIVDSEPLHLRGFQEVLLPLGIELTERRYYERYLGYDDRGCLEALHNDLDRPVPGPEEAERIIGAKTRWVQRALAESVEPLPGAVELIRQARQAGLPLAICSGALREEIEVAARKVAVRDCFDVIVAAEDVARGKPDPEGYRLALARLRERTGKAIEPARSTVVEDSPAGIEAAHAAGMRVLGVATSYPHDALAAADRIVERLDQADLDDLRALVDEA
jgi:HAD superfamily hydrolase (TIGR01509 family)